MPWPAGTARLQVCLGDPVATQRLERERVLAHPPQVFAGAAQVVAFGGEDRVEAADYGIGHRASTSSASMIR